MTEAADAKEKLKTFVGKPDNVFDHSANKGALYGLKLHPWIREITPLSQHDGHIEQRDATEYKNLLSDVISRQKILRATPTSEEARDLQSKYHYLVNQIALCLPYEEWVKDVIVTAKMEFVFKESVIALPLDTKENYPFGIYMRRLQSIGLEKYNEIIKQERELAQDMAVMNRGVAVILGQPGAGKSATGYIWAFYMKYFFEGRKAIVDSLPRLPFGEMWLFNAEKLINESKRLKEVSKGNIDELLPEESKIGADGKPISEDDKYAIAYAEMLFNNATCYFEEYGDYFPRLTGRTRMGKVIFNFHRKWRHNDLLIMGSTPEITDLDKNMCQKYITHHVEVFPHPEAPDECTVARIYISRSIGGNSVIDVVNDPVEFKFWGLKPRDFLNGDYLYNIYNTKNSQKIVMPRNFGEKDV